MKNGTVTPLIKTEEVMSWCSLEPVSSWGQQLLYKNLGHCILKRMLNYKNLGACKYWAWVSMWVKVVTSFYLFIYFHFVAYLIKPSFSPTEGALSFAPIFLLSYDITSYLFHFCSIVSISLHLLFLHEPKTKQDITSKTPQETQITNQDVVPKICFTDSTLQP